MIKSIKNKLKSKYILSISMYIYFVVQLIVLSHSSRGFLVLRFG